MTRYLSLLILAAALALGAAAPVTAALDQAFGNTVVSTYPDGRTAELWLRPTGDYTAMGRRHDRSSGHWKLADNRLCLTQSRPFWSPFKYCTALPSATSWSAKAVTGEPIRVRLVQGISTNPGPA